MNRGIDPARVLVDPPPIRREQPDLREIPDVLRDRTERLPMPDRVGPRLRPGTSTEPVTVTSAELTRLLRLSATSSKVVWTLAGAELAVTPSKVRATTTTGGVVVSVPVSTDQTGAVDIHVPIAVGTSDREAGLLVSTTDAPAGPAIIVRPWGDALVAFVWDALLRVAVALAARAGSDSKGDPLVPIALRAEPDGFTVVPMARHRKGR